ncbi:MAG: hypothetical protein IKP50_00180 [Bacilli bacterium]|nr:hypothetical protein [Bacilli bacterium]
MTKVLEPLYYYKLNESTGKIIKVNIFNYEEGRFTNCRRFYRWKNNSGITMYCYENEIDKAKDWRVYTFNNNDDFAKHMLTEYVRAKYTKYESEAKRYKRILKLLEV